MSTSASRRLPTFLAILIGAGLMLGGFWWSSAAGSAGDVTGPSGGTGAGGASGGPAFSAPPVDAVEAGQALIRLPPRHRSICLAPVPASWSSRRPSLSMVTSLLRRSRFQRRQPVICRSRTSCIPSRGSSSRSPPRLRRCSQTSSAWLWFFLAADPAVHLESVSAPVLALNGTLDLQVSAEQNEAATPM